MGKGKSKNILRLGSIDIPIRMYYVDQGIMRCKPRTVKQIKKMSCFYGCIVFSLLLHTINYRPFLQFVELSFTITI